MKPLDVTNWSRDYPDKRHPFWWGIVLLIIIEVTVVIGFIMSFFFLWLSHARLESSSWIPYSSAEIPLLYPSINTFLIFLCALSMYYGGIVMDKNKTKNFFWSVVFCCVVGLAVLYFRWLQLSQLNFNWKANAYASFVWTLSGFHFLHLTSAIAGTAVIGLFTAKGYYSKVRQLGVKVDTLYWYFVFAAWLPMYLILYWCPRLIQ
jgi:heme/copper-type cytochrome/quinol oxidase subunit 3